MKTLFPYLTYAGALPFIFCASLLAFDVQSVPVLGATEDILSVYGLVIATFLAGSHWGQHLGRQDEWAVYLPIISNVLAIGLWLGFVLLSFQMLIIAFVITFLILLFVDKHLFENEIISQNYFRTRCVVTPIVIAMLILSGLKA